MSLEEMHHSNIPLDVCVALPQGNVLLFCFQFVCATHAFLHLYNTVAMFALLVGCESVGVAYIYKVH